MSGAEAIGAGAMSGAEAMSGAWRITVESWITEDATWYGERIFTLSGAQVHSLVAALQAVIDGDVRDQLGEHRLRLRSGPAPVADFPIPNSVLDALES